MFVPLDLKAKIYLRVSKLHVWTVSFLVVLECMTEWRVSPWTKSVEVVHCRSLLRLAAPVSMFTPVSECN